MIIVKSKSTAIYFSNGIVLCSSLSIPDTAFPQINDSMCSECDRSDGRRRKLNPDNGMITL